MTFYGLSTYDRCKELVKIFKEKNITEISQDDLALNIAKHIGSSKYYETVRNYISYLIGFKMITPMDNKMFKINFGVIDD